MVLSNCCILHRRSDSRVQSPESTIYTYTVYIYRERLHERNHIVISVHKHWDLFQLMATMAKAPWWSPRDLRAMARFGQASTSFVE